MVDNVVQRLVKIGFIVNRVLNSKQFSAMDENPIKVRKEREKNTNLIGLPKLKKEKNKQ
jgi:hypothetical protein